MATTVPSTPIVELYEELHGSDMSRAVRLERAREFVADPASLARRFGDSVAALAPYQPADEGFYRARRRFKVGQVKASSTADLALRIRDAGGLRPIASDRPTAIAAAQLKALGVKAVTPEDLACAYLDRELVPTRTTGGGARADKAMRLDLLLAATDQTPIVAELKRTDDVHAAEPHRKPSTDKDPFSALVQAIACTAQLATPAQYARLACWGRAEASGDADVPAATRIPRRNPPVFDVFVVLHNRPTGTPAGGGGLGVRAVAACTPTGSSRRSPSTSRRSACTCQATPRSRAATARSTGGAGPCGGAGTPTAASSSAPPIGGRTSGGTSSIPTEACAIGPCRRR